MFVEANSMVEAVGKELETESVAEIAASTSLEYSNQFPTKLLASLSLMREHLRCNKSANNANKLRNILQN